MHFLEQGFPEWKSSAGCSPNETEVPFAAFREEPSLTELRYHDDMKRQGLRRLCRLRKKAAVSFPDSFPLLKRESSLPLKTIGLASVAVGAAALGLYLGRELRSRYKFKRRTPYDRYSHAGDEAAVGEFGMGI